ncbi:hypothetical protein C5B91_20210 [Haloferax sp. Atlit-10N]|uniref:hypothetical protein n=1 Tax=unclassified Haloferax TaxID=2625095 RepID=UPI000E279B28|nr:MULTISPECIES: hypothetical protein [unclassified Haloferax]RDZ39418.1 hypothetical protein C5B87_19470 [Haloferax sp. Atlit-16N]RDZ53933.1 hypothetical protein C5B91_20210 [Haloferax sp. Atlit-10N]
MSDQIEEIAGVIILLVISAVVIGALYTAAIGVNSEREAFQTSSDSSSPVSLQGTNITDLEVQQSLGTKASFSNGFAKGNFNWTPDSSWTLSTWVSVDDPENRTGMMTVVSADGRATILYNATTDEWVGIVYDDASMTTHQIEASATDPSNSTFLTLERSGDEIYLTESANVSASGTVNDSTSTTAVINATNLHGTLEETRVYDVRVTAGERTDLFQNPVQPISPDPVARVMYDSWGDSISGIPIFGGGTLSATGASVVEGFAGANVTSSDYEVSSGQVVRSDGGVLDGSPMYVSYASTVTTAFASALVGFSNAAQTAMIVIAISLIAVAAAWTLDMFDSAGR